MESHGRRGLGARDADPVGDRAGGPVVRQFDSTSHSLGSRLNASRHGVNALVRRSERGEARQQSYRRAGPSGARCAATRDLEARFKIQRMLHALCLHAMHAIAKAVGLPEDLERAGRAAHLEVERQQRLIAVAVGWDHHQSLLHVLDRAVVDVAVVVAHSVHRLWCLRTHPVRLRLDASAASSSSASSFRGGVASVLRTSSAQTFMVSRRLEPYWVAMATSTASRPRPMTTRPMRGTLWRASKGYQRSPRYASN